MNYFSPFPFVRFTIALILGIVIYNFFTPSHLQTIFVVWLLSISIYIALYIFRQQFKNHLLIGFAGCMVLLLTGLLRTFLVTESNFPQHYSQYVSKLSHYEVIVDNLVEEKENSWKCVAEIRSVIVNNQILPSSGKILLYFDNHTVEKPNYGDVYLIKGNPQEISAPKNPEEFDYRQYMAWQNIAFQQFCQASKIEKVGNEKPNLIKATALRTNTVADSIFTTFVEGKQEYGVANAMILGQRDDIDSELMQAYSAAGAIHVLSVSGLHVGVICAVLVFLLSFLNKRGKYGKLVMLLIILTLLWFYAFITGLSSPVLRSTFMFSVILIAKTFQRKDNSYNTVAFSAFSLLLINPYFLFNVGFQLSYLAVFGIIYFQPKLNPLVVIDKSKSWFHWLADRTWKVTTVAIAAQIATFQITIYYFHQFPNYFLFANPLVILLSSVVLMYGLGFVILAKILMYFNLETILYLLGQGLKFSIFALNKTVLWFEALPFAITKFLWISKEKMYLMYALIFTLMVLWKTQQYYWVKVSSVIVCVLIALTITKKVRQMNQDFLLIHSIPKHSAFSVVKNKRAMLLADDSFLRSRKDIGFRLNNFWAKAGVIDTLKSDLNQNQALKSFGVIAQSKDSVTVIAWKNKTFLWIGKNLKRKEFDAQNQFFDYLILANKSVSDLAQIIGKVQFKYLIIDGSYSDWYADKLSNQAKQLGLNCINLRKKGAYQITDSD